MKFASLFAIGVILIGIGFITYMAWPDPESVYRGPCPCAQHCDVTMKDCFE